MAAVETDLLDLADRLQGRVKFYPVGDPHRRLLETTFHTLRELAQDTMYGLHVSGGSMSAELVESWLNDHGVKLTKKQSEIQGPNG